MQTSSTDNSKIFKAGQEKNRLERLNRERTESVKKKIRIATVIVLILFAIFLWIGYRNKWFHSPEPLKEIFTKLGFFGLLLSVALVIFNTLFPVIPGALPSLAMFMAYGPLWGFLSVIITTICGSILSFFLSRRFGETFVKAFVPDAVYDKLIGKIADEKSATKLAVVAYIVPGFPDDATTMVCGLTKMRLSRFILICVLTKPLPTFLYLFGFSSLINWLMDLIV